MSFLSYTISMAVASALLYTSPGTSHRADKAGSSREEGAWQPAVVRSVLNFPKSAVDSAITVRLGDNNRIAVLYAFNNPCLDSVAARTRRIHDTLDVHFILKPRGASKVRSDTKPPVYGCPATIMNRGYEVTVDQPTHPTHIVRGFAGNDSAKTLIAIRVIEAR